MKSRLFTGVAIVLWLAPMMARATPEYTTTSTGGCFGHEPGTCSWQADGTADGTAQVHAEVRSPAEVGPWRGIGISILELEAAAGYTGEPRRDVPLDVTIHVASASVHHSGLVHSLIGGSEEDVISGIQVAAEVDFPACSTCSVVQYCQAEEGCDLEPQRGDVVTLLDAPRARTDEDLGFHFAIYNNDEPVPSGQFDLRIAVIATADISRGLLPDNGVVRASFTGSVTSFSIG